MIVLQAPHTLIQTTSIFPNAQLGDTVSPMGDMNLVRMMDGTTRTYVKSTERLRLTYVLNLEREKAAELLEFYFAYTDQPIRLTNWLGEVWVVYFVEDSLDIEILKRGERCSVQLVLEGDKIVNGS